MLINYTVTEKTIAAIAAWEEKIKEVKNRDDVNVEVELPWWKIGDRFKTSEKAKNIVKSIPGIFFFDWGHENHLSICFKEGVAEFSRTALAVGDELELSSSQLNFIRVVEQRYGQQ